MRKADIVAICSLPPPVNGQTLANSFYSQWLRSVASTTIVDLVPGKKIARRAVEIIRAVRAASSLKPGMIFYTVPHAGRGKLITRILTEIAAFRGAHIVLHHHGFNYLSKSYFVYRSLFARRNRVISHVFLAREMAEIFRATYKIEPNYFVINNSLLVESHREEIDEEKTKCNPKRVPLIGLMSNLSREKGLYTFLDVLYLAKKRNIALRGILAGPIASDEDKRLVARARNEIPDLEYWGPVYGVAKEKFFKAIDVFVFPTTFPVEAQPLVVYEAILRWRPVVSNDMGCISTMAGPLWLRTTDKQTAEGCLSVIEGVLRDIRNGALSAKSENALAPEIREAQESLENLGKYISVLISMKPGRARRAQS